MPVKISYPDIIFTPGYFFMKGQYFCKAFIFCKHYPMLGLQLKCSISKSL